MPEIDRFIKEKTLEATRTLGSSRRVCNVPDHFRGQQGVLGAVMDFVALVAYRKSPVLGNCDPNTDVSSRPVPYS